MIYPTVQCSGGESKYFALKDKGQRTYLELYFGTKQSF